MTQKNITSFNSTSQQRMSINNPTYSRSSLNNSSIYSGAQRSRAQQQTRVTGTNFVGNIGKANDMAKFWSGLSQIAVKNDFINRAGDRD
jgi:hypothetical protein